MGNWTSSLNTFGITAGAYSSNGYKTCAGEILHGDYQALLESLQVILEVMATNSRTWRRGANGVAYHVEVRQL